MKLEFRFKINRSRGYDLHKILVSQCTQITDDNMPEHTSENWKSWLMGYKATENGEKWLVQVVRAPDNSYFLRIKHGDKRINLRLNYIELLRCAKDIREKVLGE